MQHTLISMPATSPHPARYSDPLMPIFAQYAQGCNRILDPMAGTGKVYQLAQLGVSGEIHAIELEPEWAAWHPKTRVGDALNLPYADRYFDCICVSPAYGNRMADAYAGKDGDQRNTYRFALGRPLSNGSGASLQWGRAYRELHYRAWQESARVLCDGGLFILNIKDHIRQGKRQRVTRFHELVLLHLGLRRVAHERIECPGQRHGANGKLRISYESVLVFQKCLLERK